ncbi:MAG: SCO1664 family protein [Anaerolineae bacterium]|nr:SCO1664 family protein [Anaerolineae bacterium]
MDATLHLLSTGNMSSLGLLPWSSNYTFLVKVTESGTMTAGAANAPAGSLPPNEVLAVYKPQQGESPLWDFAEGSLCMRELAAYLVSNALGWHLIPPTVLRNGPHGLGSVQLFIENDPNVHFFTFRENPDIAEALQRLVVFDLITNNADRKSGHCLLGLDGRLWAIDHGITFNVDHKLRTVIWDFANQPLPTALLDDMQRLRQILDDSKSDLMTVLRELLTTSEIKAFKRRLDGLIHLGHFPAPSRGQRSIPWPPV